jgi:hypothetical protein
LIGVQKGIPSILAIYILKACKDELQICGTAKTILIGTYPWLSAQLTVNNPVLNEVKKEDDRIMLYLPTSYLR